MVTAPAKSVATATPAVLTCTITDITKTVTVTWKNGEGKDLGDKKTFAEYTVVQGAYDDKLVPPQQMSTLTITPAGMAALTDETTPFTCVVKSIEYAKDSPEVIATTAHLTKLAYGTFNLLLVQ